MTEVFAASLVALLLLSVAGIVAFTVLPSRWSWPWKAMVTCEAVALGTSVVLLVSLTLGFLAAAIGRLGQ